MKSIDEKTDRKRQRVIPSFASHEYRSDCHRKVQNIIYSRDIASVRFLAILQIDILGIPTLESLPDNGVLFY